MLASQRASRSSHVHLVPTLHAPSRFPVCVGDSDKVGVQRRGHEECATATVTLSWDPRNSRAVRHRPNDGRGDDHAKNGTSTELMQPNL